MAPRVRDVLVISAAIILIVAAVMFAVVLPGLELRQVRRELENPPATTQQDTGMMVPSSNETSAQGPPSFTLLVTPVEARIRPGGTVVYMITVEPGGGFQDRIDLRLDLHALLLYQRSFDLGVIDPPYPKTIEYRFDVPGDIPSGTTIEGVLSGEGGGYRDTVDLVLLIT